MNGILDRTNQNICLQIGPDKRARVNRSGHFPVSRQTGSNLASTTGLILGSRLLGSDLRAGHRFSTDYGLFGVETDGRGGATMTFRGSFPISSANEAREFARIVVEAGENQLEVGNAGVLRQYFADDGAKIRG